MLRYVSGASDEPLHWGVGGVSRTRQTVTTAAAPGGRLCGKHDIRGQAFP